MWLSVTCSNLENLVLFSLYQQGLSNLEMLRKEIRMILLLIYFSQYPLTYFINSVFLFNVCL